RKTATDGSKVDAVPRLVLGPADGFVKPLKSVLPAVQAKGRPSFGSLSPGAWPTSKMRDGTARPTTTGRLIWGQSVQVERRARCWATARVEGAVDMWERACSR